MLHTTNPVIKHKAGLLNLAEELSNVSKACKIMGVSRDTFYRYRELADEGGVDALINRSRRAPNLKNRTDEATEQAVIDYAVAFPAHGQHRTSTGPAPDQQRAAQTGRFYLRQWCPFCLVTP